MYKTIKIILYTLTISIVFIVAFFALQIYKNNIDSDAVSITQKDNNKKIPPTILLLRHNDAFAKGMAAQKTKQYDLALLYYQQSFQDIQNIDEESQVKYAIAKVYEKKGENIKTIQLLKEIVANPSYSKVFKAYAVQEMAQMYFKRVNNSNLVYDEIFKDAPYLEMKDATNKSVSYLHLFEFAVSFESLGISESKIAYLHTKDLLSMGVDATSTPAGILDVKLIQDSLLKTDAFIRRVQDNPIENVDIPAILSIKGYVQGKLFSLGIGDSQSVEHTFQDALRIAAVTIQPGNIYAYFYASFIANYYGQKRSSDIENLLLPFSASSTSKIDPDILPFLKAAKNSIDGEHKNLVTLAQIDTSFKLYLTSIGWSQNDFLTK